MYEYQEIANKCEPPAGEGWRLHTVYNYHDGPMDRATITSFFVWERQVADAPTETPEQAHARGRRAGRVEARVFLEGDAIEWPARNYRGDGDAFVAGWHAAIAALRAEEES